MQIPKEIQTILDTIESHGFQAYLVGGCVRDFLLGQTPSDYDVATDAHPQQIMECFDRCIPTGLPHGTVTVLAGQPVEVTTFRQETEYADHRHPNAVHFVSRIQDDLARRDFTINAMAYHPKQGLVDPFGGKEDLETGIIRCVGEARQRFEEDALRLLRAHRFAARFHFQIEEQTAQAMQACQDLIRYVSVERIRQEVMLTLQADPYQLEQMTGLLKPWIPELEACLHCEQNTKYHDTNVLHHTCRALKLLEPYEETLAYVLLIHDLAKPACKTHTDGQDHFKGHPKAGMEIAQRLCREWKLTRQQQKWIPLLVRYHDSRIREKDKFIKDFCIKYHWPDQQIRNLFKVKHCDILAHSPLGQKSIEDLKELEQAYEQAKQTRPLSFGDLAINGQDVVQEGLQGAEVQLALQDCLEYMFDHPEQNTKEGCLARIRQKKGGKR
ncbi:MAG: CCA tRNA nucleotidyltransferase [Erysipelotrichaceae bacterium]|nr:CCA tRNA nucleotidyltransferase [Erysipelotrichaceae bacterium]